MHSSERPNATAHRAILLLHPSIRCTSDTERDGVRGRARPCRQPPKPASHLPSSIFHLPPSSEFFPCILCIECSESFSCILYTESSEFWTAVALARMMDT